MFILLRSQHVTEIVNIWRKKFYRAVLAMQIGELMILLQDDQSVFPSRGNKRFAWKMWDLARRKEENENGEIRRSQVQDDIHFGR